MPRIWKQLFTVMLLVMAIFVFMFWILNPVGLLPNNGLSVGYHGKHNISKTEVLRVPGISIVRERLHNDVSLEDSSIHVRHKGEAIELWFNWQSLPDDVDPRELLAGLESMLDERIESDLIEKMITFQ